MGTHYRRITATLLILIAPAVFAQSPPEKSAPILFRKHHLPKLPDSTHSPGHIRVVGDRAPARWLPGDKQIGASQDLKSHPGPDLFKKFSPALQDLPPSRGDVIETASGSAQDSVYQSWMTRYASPPGRPADDLATKMTMDRDGNVYVTGLSDSTLTQFDIVVIKYDSSGAVMWAVRYDGPGHLSDSPAAIVVDSEGNVIVAGSTGRSWTNVDALLLKLDSDGNILWAVDYDSPSGRDDSFSGVAVDLDGNIYAAGLTGGSTDPESGDALLVKHNLSGGRQWVAIFDGEAHRHDHATAVKVDGGGNVYTTGLSRSFGEYWNSDIVTMRYDGLSGNVVWNDQYDNSESSEEPRAMAIDISGNTYVTGLCTRALGGGGYTVDYVTMKHDPQGNRLWTALYDGPTQGWDQPNDIVVDSDEYVHVTGMSGALEPNGGYDILTLRYDADGVQQWSQRFAETNHTEVALGIGLDGQKNIYVTGWTAVDGANFLTLKYDSQGVYEWKKQYAGTGRSDDQAVAIAVSPSGRFYVAGQTYTEETGEDLLTVGYEADGRQVWRERFDGPGVSTNIARAMTADLYGNTYLTGGQYTLATGWDFLTVKCDAAGHIKWAANYDGPYSSSDVPQAIVTDRLDNVYVAGFAEGATNLTVVVKYDPNGVMQWEQLFSDNFPRAIAVDSLGNIYVVGYHLGANLLDFSTLKYNPAGELQWSADYDGALHNNDGAFAVAIGPTGNAYVTGPGFMTSQLADYITVKYGPDGTLLWARSMDGPAAGEDNPYAIVVDDSGNAYVTGTSTSQSGDFDIVTVKYDREGDEQWLATYDDGGGRNDQGFAMALDRESNAYITGVVEGATGPADFDFLTMKYAPDGTLRWTRKYDGAGNQEDAAIAVGLDQHSGVYVSGPSYGIENGFDIATVKYDSNGNYQWAARFAGGMNREDIPVGVSVSATGSVFIGGTSGGEWSSNLFTFLQYNQIIPPPPPSPPIALFSEKAITFETVELECRATEFVTVQNAGLGTLVISSITSNDSSFSVIPSSCTISPGRTVDLEITFDPVSPGVHAGQIILDHNAASPHDSIIVQGVADGTGTPTLISALLEARWNLVSLPVNSVCPYSFAGLFEYHGTYSQSGFMVVGAGYWKKYPGPSTQVYVGNPVLEDTIAVAPGWNLIGMIGTPVTTDQIESDPPGLVTSPFYGFQGSYVEVSTLSPGLGYWVRVDEPGALILNAGGDAMSGAARIRIVTSDEYPPSPPGDQIPSGPEYHPRDFSLHGNYPNPFNPSTKIRYEVPEYVHVTLTVHDILGREIVTLVNEPREAGWHEAYFDGTDLPGGIYLYRIRAGRFTDAGKMSLVK